MGFLLGIALLIVGASFTKDNARTTVTLKAYSLPQTNIKRGENPLAINNIGIEIGRSF